MWSRARNFFTIFISYIRPGGGILRFHIFFDTPPTIKFWMHVMHYVFERRPPCDDLKQGLLCAWHHITLAVGGLLTSFDFESTYEKFEIYPHNSWIREDRTPPREIILLCKGHIWPWKRLGENLNLERGEWRAKQDVEIYFFYVFCHKNCSFSHLNSPIKST